MLTPFRNRQRTRLSGQNYVSLSFLPQERPGRFLPFQGLSWFLDTTLKPGGKLLRSLTGMTDFVLAVLSGELHVLTEGGAGVQASRDQIVRLTPGRGEQVEISAVAAEDPESPGGAVFLEIGLTPPEWSLPVAPARQRESVLVQPVDLRPPFPRFVTVASANPEAGGVPLVCDANLHWAKLRSGENLIFETDSHRSSFLVVLGGTVQVGVARLLGRDWVLIERESELRVSAAQTSRFLLIDLPTKWPEFEDPNP